MKRQRRKTRTTKIDTLVGAQTHVNGDIAFAGGLHIDGTIRGNVSADDTSASVLTLSEQGTIEGDVKVPHIVINGVVIGDVYAYEYIELASNSRISGDVYYRLIEMAMGAEVNGNLVRRDEGIEVDPELGGEAAYKMAD